MENVSRWSRIKSYWNQPNHVGYLFVLPSMIALLLFAFIPVAIGLGMSLFDVNIFFNGTKFVGLQNFARFFSDSRAINSIWHTVYFTVLETPVQVLVGVLCAAALSRNTRFNRFCRSTFYIPVVCSLTAIGLVFNMLLDPNIGWLPHAASLIGMHVPDFFADATWAMPTIAFLTVWKSFGVTMIIMLTAVQAISPSLYESAEMDGANRRQQFFHVTIPQVIPALGFCILTNLTGSMQVFDQIFVTTGGGPNFKTESAVQYIYMRGFSSPYELGYASSVATVLFCFIAVIAIGSNLYMTHKEKQMR